MINVDGNLKSLRQSNCWDMICALLAAKRLLEANSAETRAYNDLRGPKRFAERLACRVH